MQTGSNLELKPPTDLPPAPLSAVKYRLRGTALLTYFWSDLMLEKRAEYASLQPFLHACLSHRYDAQSSNAMDTNTRQY
jgi:hypothetical protein